nr:unnamed protein product [Callosobruchus analis]
MANLRTACINIRSLYPKMNAIRSLLQSEGISILGITETWLNSKLHHEMVIIEGLILLYCRPPHNDIDRSLSALDQLISCTCNLPYCDEIIVMGDMNVNLVNQNSRTIKSNEVLSTYNYYNYVQGSLVSNVKHIDMHEFSVHQLIYCDLNIKCCKKEAPRVSSYRDFSRFDYDLFKMD